MCTSNIMMSLLHLRTTANLRTPTIQRIITNVLVLVLVIVVSRKSMTFAIYWGRARAARYDAPYTDELARNAQ
jgi:hypothetical protein